MVAPTLILAPDLAALAERAAAEIAARSRREPLHLVCATGKTMEPVYAALVRMARAGDWDPLRVDYFNLDEYRGLALDFSRPPAEDRSFARYLHERLLKPLDVPTERIHLMHGDVERVERYAELYRERLFGYLRPVVTLLGLGRSGHVAFNEPGSAADDRMRVVDLGDDTRRDNFGADSDGAPRQALTLGPAEILQSDVILLLAAGAAKAAPAARALTGPVGPECPAGFLQTHPRVLAFLDEAAAALLPADWRARAERA